MHVTALAMTLFEKGLVSYDRMVPRSSPFNLG